MAIVLMFIAAGILFLGFRMVPAWFPHVGVVARRRLVGTACVLAGLVFWLATAVLLVYEHRSYMLGNFLAPMFIFGGIALFLPPPQHEELLPPHTDALKVLHGGTGQIIIWAGLGLSILHTFLFSNSQEYVLTLLRLYASFGLRGNL